MINVNTSGHTNKTRKGLFVVFEGGEGSGKSTQARLLSKALCALGVDNHLTREPGDTELGADLREILLKRGRSPITPKAEALLFAADRAEHVEKLIRPALDRGDVVICDRYIASSVVYQGHTHGIQQAVKDISEWASDSLKPDITFLLDIPVHKGLARARKVEHTSFEDRTVDFHNYVRHAYRYVSDHTWYVLNGENSVDTIHRIVVEKTLEAYQKKVLDSADDNSSTNVSDSSSCLSDGATT